MDLSERIDAFAKLGDYLKDNLHDAKEINLTGDNSGETFFNDPELLRISVEAQKINPWFIPGFIHHALAEISRILEKDTLGEWTIRYPLEDFHPKKSLIVGTILAGNIPAVGFHDFLSILLSGNHFKGKASGKDNKLLPFLAEKLKAIEPRFAQFLHFEESHLGIIDAMIATGGNNSFRYFDYYFGKYPHIFRKNRNGIAILTGDEPAMDLRSLADDIFLYFGMGCRNVTKLYVPEGYSFDAFFGEMEKYQAVTDHHKYANNYLYQRSVFLMNQVKHLDNGFLLLRKDPATSSPVGTLHYETYQDKSTLLAGLQTLQDSIQCIAGPSLPGLRTVDLGSTQFPKPWDYADNVDTLNFLLNLSKK